MTVSFPNVKIKNSQFGLSFNVQEFASPYSQSVQITRLPGERWTATYEFPPMTHIQFSVLKAFILGQQGGANTFYGFDPDAVTPRGTATGTPIVNGGEQTGKQLQTTGWTHSTSGILLQGDYIQFGNQLRMVMEDADSDSSGNALLILDSPMRLNPTDGQAIITTKASCPMRIKDQVNWSSDCNKIYTCSFSAIEVF
jgi:hypothetical protein